MATVSNNEIIRKIEELKDGSRLSLRLSSTCGAGAVITALNPSHAEKGQKKFLMWWGNDEVQAGARDPFTSSDKAKTIASWTADRSAQWAT